MNERELLRVLDGLARPRVLIVGDLILDRYVDGEVSRISPEAPIPILAARSTEDRLGGACNVAANLRAMEAAVEILGVVGKDQIGMELLSLMRGIGIQTEGCVVDAERPTIEKTRMISGVHQILRVDWEKAHPIPAPIETGLLAKIDERVATAHAVILSDYGKGVLTRRVCQAVIAAARRARVPVLVDPKGSDYTRYAGATLVTPNRKEAEQAIGRRLASFDDLPDAARELMRIASLDCAVITLGGDGIYYLDANGGADRVPTQARKVFDVTGAGDTVIANLALGLGAGLELGVAVRLANHAAGIVVGRLGAASVTRAELRAALGERLTQRSKLLTQETLATALAEWRSEGRKIVFTNGCFDVLHAGHVQYLREARSQGDVLVVGVNDDASVRRLKGAARPVNAIDDRMYVLGALEMVDGVIAFPEDTPLRLVQEVTPNVLVKGEDWADKGVVGREWVEQHGGRVHLAHLLPGRSTTSILERAGQPPGAAGIARPNC
ncbi:MAG: D-glycero-beta-D-manno-heptose-7-phosphate kinase [Planctomycetota bacterium]|nr:MAG: D-glycero-beta-D-manno-heptose-7-phosphate kinase [Planctomycetota bacterium]